MGAKPIHRILHKLHSFSRNKLEVAGARLKDDELRPDQDFR